MVLAGRSGEHVCYESKVREFWGWKALNRDGGVNQHLRYKEKPNRNMLTYAATMRLNF